MDNGCSTFRPSVVVSFSNDRSQNKSISVIPSKSSRWILQFVNPRTVQMLLQLITIHNGTSNDLEISFPFNLQSLNLHLLEIKK